MERMPSRTGRRTGPVKLADHAQNSFFQGLVIMLFGAQPFERRIEIIQGFRQPWIAVREEPEYTVHTVLPGTTTVGAALLTNSPVQVTVTQEATQYRQRCCIRMVHGNSAVGLGAEVHLGRGQPGFAGVVVHRLHAPAFAGFTAVVLPTSFQL